MKEIVIGVLLLGMLVALISGVIVPIMTDMKEMGENVYSIVKDTNENIQPSQPSE